MTWSSAALLSASSQEQLLNEPAGVRLRCVPAHADMYGLRSPAGYSNHNNPAMNLTGSEQRWAKDRRKMVAEKKKEKRQKEEKGEEEGWQG